MNNTPDLTMERLLTMTQAELLATPYGQVYTVIEAAHDARRNKGAPGMLIEAVDDHFRALIAPLVEPHVAAFEAAYRNDPDSRVPALAAAVAAEHPLVVLATWSRLTSCGIAQLDKAKWVHRELVHTVLGAMGLKVGG